MQQIKSGSKTKQMCFMCCLSFRSRTTSILFFCIFFFFWGENSIGTFQRSSENFKCKLITNECRVSKRESRRSRCFPCWVSVCECVSVGIAALYTSAGCLWMPRSLETGLHHLLTNSRLLYISHLKQPPELSLSWAEALRRC